MVLDARRREASQLLNTGSRDRAVAIFEEVLAADPQRARSHRDLGLALLRAERPAQAAAHLEAAQRLDPSEEGFAHLAQAYSAAGDGDAASRQLALYRATVEQAKRQRIRELMGVAAPARAGLQ